MAKKKKASKKATKKAATKKTAKKAKSTGKRKPNAAFMKKLTISDALQELMRALKS